MEDCVDGAAIEVSSLEVDSPGSASVYWHVSGDSRQAGRRKEGTRGDERGRESSREPGRFLGAAFYAAVKGPLGMVAPSG